MDIEDTGEVRTLGEITKDAAKRPPGYEVVAKQPPANAPRYRLTAPCYLHSRLWAAGDIVAYAGKPNGSMVLVDEKAEVAAKQSPRHTKNVI